MTRPTFVPVDDSDGGSSELSFDGNAPTSAALALHSDHPSQPPPSSQSRVTREDLNAAIEAGDWAVVGATAALLADSNVSDQSLSESEHGLQSKDSFFSEASESNHRAAELDRMVENADWAGVVAAAAQIQGTSSFDGREDESTQYSCNSKSGSPSTKEKEEIRAEVEVSNQKHWCGRSQRFLLLIYLLNANRDWSDGSCQMK